MPLYDVSGDAWGGAEQLYDSMNGVDDGERIVRLNAADMPVGFAGADVQDIAAGASATFTCNLNMLLRPDRIVLEDAAAPSLVLTDVRVGAISLNVSSGEACGDAFRRDAVQQLKGAVSGTPSVPIKVTVRNKTAATAVAKTAVAVIGPIKRVA